MWLFVPSCFLIQWWKVNLQSCSDCWNKIQFQAHLGDVSILDVDIIPFWELTTNGSSPTWHEGMFRVCLNGKWRLMVPSLVWPNNPSCKQPWRGLPAAFTRPGCTSFWDERPVKDPEGCLQKRSFPLELILNKMGLYDQITFPSTLKVCTKNVFHWCMQIDTSETERRFRWPFLL